MNYYQILGVDNNAELIIIRAAYKTLIQKYHPDKAKTPKESDEFLLKTKEINKAYSTLSDEKLRSSYDENFNNYTKESYKEHSKEETLQTNKNNYANSLYRFFKEYEDHFLLVSFISGIFIPSALVIK